MHVQSVYIRRYRSIESAALTACGGLNVLIGKNNSGKSNILSAIDLCQRHLSRGSIAGPWATPRPQDEFTDRRCSDPIQIGIEFDLDDHTNEAFRKALQAESPHLEKPIANLAGATTISFVIAGVHANAATFLFVEQIGIGPILPMDQRLEIQGVNLLNVPVAVGKQLYDFEVEDSRLRSDIRSIEALLEDQSRLKYLSENKEGLRYMIQGDMRPATLRELEALIATAANADELATKLKGVMLERYGKLEALQSRETDEPMTTFAGTTKAAPAYVEFLMTVYGGISVLHLRETRDAVGREEADALLTLKVTRGGPERLANVQRTVKSLLGVNVDAFQSEQPPRRGNNRSAEIDIDQFLIEANGAGVREALRLVLDLELKKPSLVLIEEPEVHLHPGLEHSVYQYLRDKSLDLQIFVTTHSTSFVDSVSFQNIYLVSKTPNHRTAVETLDSGEGALKVPAELGLRLSTLFMFDRLIFVEGPSDEAVLRELCKTLNFDVATANVGFVQMGGVRNFAHFAAEATIGLLSKRQVKMWFIADRDERHDSDVKRMLDQLGDRAVLHVLRRREIENYLLDAKAVAKLVAQKQPTGSTSARAITVDEIRAAIEAAARSLRDEVVRLRVQRQLLGPLHLLNRQIQGSIEQRLDAGIVELQTRLGRIASATATVDAEMKDFDATAIEQAPGALILDGALKEFGLRFNKDGGDSARLARLVERDAIPTELSDLLRECTAH